MLVFDKIVKSVTCLFRKKNNENSVKITFLYRKHETLEMHLLIIVAYQPHVAQEIVPEHTLPVRNIFSQLINTILGMFCVDGLRAHRGEPRHVVPKQSNKIYNLAADTNDQIRIVFLLAYLSPSSVTLPLSIFLICKNAVSVAKVI